MKITITASLLLSACAVLAQTIPTSEVIAEADLLIDGYQFEKALAIMDRAQDSLDVSLLQRKGYCYSRLGNYAEAITAYEAVRMTDLLDREALYRLGQLYSVNDQYDQSRVCYEKLIRLDSANSFYYKEYAAVALKAGDVVTAMGKYLQTVRLNPRDVEAYAKFADLLIDAEQVHFADSMLTAVLSAVENNQLRLLLARANLAEENHEAVVSNVERVLATGDTTVTSARLLGISYFHLERYGKVIPCMEFLLSKGLKADWIYYFLGASYQQVNEPLKAIEFLSLAIEEGISDNIGTYYTQLGMAYEDAKDFRNAIRNYKAAYETSKADILLYHLARNYDVYYKDKTQAQVYYKRYLESDDTIKLAKDYSRHRLNALTDGR
ncbi:MAG TPA: tetratricopeptide repeat protein [Chryseosolibacter sp.]